MIRNSVAALLALTMAAGSVLAQESAAGMWRVEFVTPQGQVGVNMTINQTGNKLTGQVTDEYGIVQPSGRFAVDGRGNYSFTVRLQAGRHGGSKSGRHYWITATASDLSGNVVSASTVVTVPHDHRGR